MSKEVKAESVSLCPLGTAAAPEQEPLCIFGTGDFGRSLGQRLLQSGYRVVYGSRRPHSCGALPQGAQVMSHAAAAQSASLVILCVHREHYDFLETLAPQLRGKVLVDVSNNLKKNLYPEANAEYLHRLIPGAHVVKAFNTLSAWALQNGPSDANRQVLNNKTSEFDTNIAWRSDSYLAMGILGFGLYVLLGISSLPSVSNALSWREFSFIQSKLGYLTLFFCTFHTYLYGWNRFLYPSSYKWYTPPAFMLSLVVPSVVMVLKLLLLLPCVDRSLTRIRQGWERMNPEEDSEKSLLT
ncbi:metalloreductase STEAP4-like isoform X2 [Enoplosus armatus]|uniref:metalloreductase STEAP4-like isoform X2 n=1 Tax=Enoplosus armatus TaxID=215367 RepID=UPI003994F87B